jgi:uracil-DNA glycosylase family 4
MDDPRHELRSLVHELRRQLATLEQMGVYSLPAGSRAEASELAAPGPRRSDDPPPAAQAADPSPAAQADDPPLPDSEAAAGPRRTLQIVREEVGECTRCKLAPTRSKLVFGVGAEDAPLMFVGEAPGAEEDRRGEPFVGAAGQLLDRMIAAMGWTRESVYIANVLMCRPPGNRDPQPDEVSQCLPFLHRKIEVIRPRIIVALGKPATHALLSTTAPISALRGRFHPFRGIKVMPTYHPAFLLRSPDRKRDAWSDLKQVIEELERIGVRSPNPAKV